MSRKKESSDLRVHVFVTNKKVQRPCFCSNKEVQGPCIYRKKEVQGPCVDFMFLSRRTVGRLRTYVLDQEVLSYKSLIGIRLSVRTNAAM